MSSLVERTVVDVRVTLRVTTPSRPSGSVVRRPVDLGPRRHAPDGPADCAGRARTAPAGEPPPGGRASPPTPRTGDAACRRPRSRPAAVAPRRRTARAAPARRGSTPSRRAAGRGCPWTSGRASSMAAWKIGSVRSVGSDSVRWRVIVRNDESRIFTRDRRRPGRPTSAVARTTPSAMPSSVRSMISGSLVSTSNVCSCPTDLAGSPSWTRSSSTPWARDTSEPPCFPNRRTTRSAGSAARSPIVFTPYSAQHRGGLLADTPQAPDRQRREERGLVPGRHDDEAVWLAQVRGDLRNELRRRDADRDGQPDLLAGRRLDPAGDRLPVAEERGRAGDVEERLVDRDRLDLGREPAQDGHDVPADAIW